tara:strand:+ start:62 stop:1096 length:1035 start_codon:yes stop_codon:yes gene_type:complete
MRIPILIFLLATSASAQSFNVDLGLNAAPSATYGGAAGQAGTWNEVNGIALVTDVPLLDLDGQPSAVTLRSSATTGLGATFCNLHGGGDEGALMGDSMFQVDFAAQNRDIELTFDGLEPGWYQVYTYSWDPCSATSSVIAVVDSPDFRSPCGDNDWPEGQRYRRTYVRHRKLVTDGTLTIRARSRHAQSFVYDPAVNGVQLVLHGSEPILGDTYCWLPDFNSTGQSATLDLVGSPEVLFDNVELRVRALPFDVPLVLLMSTEPAYSPAPGFGTLCLGGSVSYLGPVLDSGFAGVVSLHVAISTPATNPSVQVLAGETWYFQAWYRDSALAQPSNLSDAVRATFE